MDAGSEWFGAKLSLIRMFKDNFSIYNPWKKGGNEIESVELAPV